MTLACWRWQGERSPVEPSSVLAGKRDITFGSVLLTETLEASVGSATGGRVSTSDLMSTSQTEDPLRPLRLTSKRYYLRDPQSYKVTEVCSSVFGTTGET